MARGFENVCEMFWDLASESLEKSLARAQAAQAQCVR